MQRRDIEFPSGKEKDLCRGWLYVPEGTGPFPVVVMAHGLGAIKEMRLPAYAERFCAEGYACVVFDYRHFGSSDGTPRQLLDIDRQLEDWAAAIAYAHTLDIVKKDAVAVWGTSFGGGHAIITAAQVPGVTAAIAQCPFTDGMASAMAMDFQSSIKVTTRALADTIGSALGGEPKRIATAGPPHSAALMTAPDAEPGYLQLLPEGQPFQNEVLARVGLHIAGHRPGRFASKIACPILFCICETDTVAPSGPTKKYAALAPRGEVRLYQEGHFDIYVGAGFEKAVADQLDFLKRHVPARA